MSLTKATSFSFMPTPALKNKSARFYVGERLLYFLIFHIFTKFYILKQTANHYYYQYLLLVELF